MFIREGPVVVSIEGYHLTTREHLPSCGGEVWFNFGLFVYLPSRFHEDVEVPTPIALKPHRDCGGCVLDRTAAQQTFPCLLQCRNHIQSFQSTIENLSKQAGCPFDEREQPRESSNACLLSGLANPKVVKGFSRPHVVKEPSPRRFVSDLLQFSLQSPANASSGGGPSLKI